MKRLNLLLSVLVCMAIVPQLFGQTNDIGIRNSFMNMLNDPPDFIDSLTRLYYTRIPKKEAASTPLTFGVQLNNYGSNAASNARLYVHVSGAGSYTDSSVAVTVNAGDSAFLRITNSTFSPNAQGTYHISMRVGMDSTDQAPGNDSVAANVPGVSVFDVTDTVWARDNNQVGGSFYFGPTFIYKVGNLFTLDVLDTATSISCHIASNNSPNIVIALHIWDDPYSTNPTPLATSDYYTVTANDLGNWVTLPFASGPVVDNNHFAILTPGRYLVGVETFDDPTYISKGQTSGVAEGVVLCDPNNYDSWFYATSGVPKIRLNMGSRYYQQTGMKEVKEHAAASIFPNPTKGIFHIRGKGSVSVCDLLGNQLVIQPMDGTMDLSSYPDGIYFVKVGEDVLKLVLNK